MIGGLRYDSYELDERLGGRAPATGCRRASPSASRRSSAGVARRAADLRHLRRGLSLAVGHGDADQRPASGRRHLPVPAQSGSQARDRQDLGVRRQLQPGRRRSRRRQPAAQGRLFQQRRRRLYRRRRRLSAFDPTSGCPFRPDLIGNPGYIPICFQYQNFAEAKIKGFELESVYDAGWCFAGLSASIIDGHTISYEGVREDLTHHPVLAGDRPARLPLLRGQADGRAARCSTTARRRAMRSPTTIRWSMSSRAIRRPRTSRSISAPTICSTSNMSTRSTDRRRSPLYEPGITLKLAATMRLGG